MPKGVEHKAFMGVEREAMVRGIVCDAERR